MQVLTRFAQVQNEARAGPFGSCLAVAPPSGNATASATGGNSTASTADTGSNAAAIAVRPPPSALPLPAIADACAQADDATERKQKRAEHKRRLFKA